MTRNRSEEEVVNELSEKLLNFDEEDGGPVDTVENATVDNTEQNVDLPTEEQAKFGKISTIKDSAESKEQTNGDGEKEGDKDEDEAEAPEEYEVEEILEHKEKRGAKFYLIKWKGYGLDDCTWEAEANVYADDLVKEYWRKKEEDSTKSQGKGKKRSSRASTPPPVKQETKKQRSAKKPRQTKEFRIDDDLDDDDDWEFSVVAVETVTRDDKSGELMVYLKWQNGETSRHPASEANKKCPQKMIKFYEQRLTFAPPNLNKTIQNIQ